MADLQLRKRIGESIKARRKLAGFKSAESLAKIIGISTSRYYEYESGRVALPFDIAWQIAEALGCSLDELGGRDFAPTALPRPYDDPRQASINAAFEVMNDRGRDMLAGVADSFARDVENRGSSHIGDVAAGMTA